MIPISPGSSRSGLSNGDVNSIVLSSKLRYFSLFHRFLVNPDSEAPVFGSGPARRAQRDSRYSAVCHKSLLSQQIRHVPSLIPNLTFRFPLRLSTSRLMHHALGHFPYRCRALYLHSHSHQYATATCCPARSQTRVFSHLTYPDKVTPHHPSPGSECLFQSTAKVPHHSSKVYT